MVKQSDARRERYGRVKVGCQAATLARPPQLWRGRPNFGAPAPGPEREFWPVLPVFYQFEGPFAGKLKGRLGGLKDNLETF